MRYAPDDARLSPAVLEHLASPAGIPLCAVVGKLPRLLRDDDV